MYHKRSLLSRSTMNSIRISITLLFVVLVLLSSSVECMSCEDSPCITIGAITNGFPTVNETSITRYNHNISLIWHYVDTLEVYHIFRAIQILDAQEDVDLIMLFDYEPSILKMPEILQTTNKKLIKWGEKTQEEKTTTGGTSEGTAEIEQPNNSELCGDGYDQDLLFDDLYCQTDINVTDDNANSSIINESLTLTAPRAMTSLVEELSWQSVTILHENATEREATELVDLLSNSGIKFSIFNVDMITDLHSLLHKAYFSLVPYKHQLNVVVLCRFFCVRRIFRTANQFDALNTQRKTLLKQFGRWLVAVYGHSMGVSRALQACASDLDNVAIIAIPEFSGAGTQDFYEILKGIMSELFMFDDHVPDTSATVKEYISTQLALKAATWNPVTTKCKGYHIDTLLWLDGRRSFSPVGYMDASGGVTVLTELFPNIKYGYNKRNFLIAILPYEPFVYRAIVNITEMVNGTETVNGTRKVYSGFCIDMLKQLAYTLNFTYTLTEPEDGKWGGYANKSAGLFNGLAGLLQREEVDMQVAPLATTSSRERVMDFTYPFYYEYTTVVTRKPDGDATKWRTLVDPFKWQVLLFIGVSLPIVTTLVFLLEKYNPYYDTIAHNANRESNGGLNSWANSFWYIYGALLCQGGVHLPDSTTGRTLVSFWWIFCIIVVGTYSGNLIAFLTVTKEKAPFDTLEELVKMKGTYKWGTLGGTNWENLFMTSTIPIYKKVGDGLREFNQSDPAVLDPRPEYHINKVLMETYAWIGDKTFIEKEMATKCDLIRMKEEFVPMKYAVGFPNNSPHTQIFSEQMMKIHEGGLLQIWKRKWWPKANFCAPKSLTEAKAISLIDVQSAFYVCIVGIFFGTVAFITENLVFKYRSYMGRNKNGGVGANGCVIVQNGSSSAQVPSGSGSGGVISHRKSRSEQNVLY